MPKTKHFPNSLAEAIRYFADRDVALTFLATLRWPGGVTCPACEAKNPGFLKTRRIWKCRECGRQFSVKLGTIFEDSPIGLDKWLPALWLLANAKNGISSYELARGLGVTQKTAWFMLHRIRAAMESKTFRKLSGDVEADESFIGGLAKFMHQSKRKRMVRGTGGMDKTAVFGVLERSTPGKPSRVIAQVVTRIRKRDLHAKVQALVEAGADLHTDALRSYRGLEETYRHHVIDHAVAYVEVKVHTNGLENLWSAAHAHHQCHLFFDCPVPFPRLSGRTGASVQQPGHQRPGPLPRCTARHHRQAAHLPRSDRGGFAPRYDASVRAGAIG